MWLRHAVLPHVSLSRFQAIVGLIAGLMSIGGAFYSFVHTSDGTPLSSGELVMVVQDARSAKPVSDATVEILTPRNALVTTVIPNDSGRARRTLKQGAYRLRVSHPRFRTEVRDIEVMAGLTSAVRVGLSHPASHTSPTGEAQRAMNEGLGAIRRLFE